MSSVQVESTGCKFARRNKVAIGTTAAVAASLILGIAGTTWQAYRATQAEGIATKRLGIVESQQAEIERERRKAIAEADREARLARDAKAKAIAEAERADNEAELAKAVNDFLNNDLLRMGTAVSQVGCWWALGGGFRLACRCAVGL